MTWSSLAICTRRVARARARTRGRECEGGAGGRGQFTRVPPPQHGRTAGGTHIVPNDVWAGRTLMRCAELACRSRAARCQDLVPAVLAGALQSGAASQASLQRMPPQTHLCHAAGGAPAQYPHAFLQRRHIHLHRPNPCGGEPLQNDPDIHTRVRHGRPFAQHAPRRCLARWQDRASAGGGRRCPAREIMLARWHTKARLALRCVALCRTTSRPRSVL